MLYQDSTKRLGGHSREPAKTLIPPVQGDAAHDQHRTTIADRANVRLTELPISKVGRASPDTERHPLRLCQAEHGLGGTSYSPSALACGSKAVAGEGERGSRARGGPAQERRTGGMAAVDQPARGRN